jgi:hypothetical protein
MAQQQGAACRSSAPGITFVPLCASRSGFGPAYTVSKLLKFFKLFGERLRKETQGKHATVRLIAVTHIRVDASIERCKKRPLQSAICGRA